MRRFLYCLACLLLAACARVNGNTPSQVYGDVLPPEAQRVIDRATATAAAVATHKPKPPPPTKASARQPPRPVWARWVPYGPLRPKQR